MRYLIIFVFLAALGLAHPARADRDKHDVYYKYHPEHRSSYYREPHEYQRVRRQYYYYSSPVHRCGVYRCYWYSRGIEYGHHSHRFCYTH